MASLRGLPSIDALLRSAPLEHLISHFGVALVKRELRHLQDRWRLDSSAPDWAVEPSGYVAPITSALQGNHYRAVFNLTGTVIHTNLGRAPLSAEILADAVSLATRPMNLEYDIASGRRGNRDKVVEDRLKVITGAEAATVVNNNAAALMLVLNTFALGKTVPVSRGELVEIGGSFRLPDIMARSGCRLKEVGTTNRTHADDFSNALNQDTGLLLKVHPSNYHIAGFTENVEIKQMAEIAHNAGLPLAVDLGSGSLVNLERWGLPHEPTPQEVLAQGADLVTFSGDKLLGSVQAGLILGAKRYVEPLKNNPMKRALRPDKLTLVVLERTLALYDEPDRLATRLPLLRILTTPMSELEQRGSDVAERLTGLLPSMTVTTEPSHCQIGSGSLPDQTIPSRAVVIGSASRDAVRQLTKRLRGLSIPVIGRLQQDRLWLDMRGALPFDELATVLDELLDELDETATDTPTDTPTDTDS